MLEQKVNVNESPEPTTTMKSMTKDGCQEQSLFISTALEYLITSHPHSHPILNNIAVKFLQTTPILTHLHHIQVPWTDPSTAVNPSLLSNCFISVLWKQHSCQSLDDLD
jgi:hypothetical protein